MSHIALIFRAIEGGVVRTQVTLANALCARGHRVSIVVPTAASLDPSSLDESIGVEDLGSRSYLGFVARLVGYLRRARPDRVLASQHHTAALCCLAAIISRSRVPVVVVFHNHLSELLSRERHGWVLLALIRSSLWRADKVVGVSAGVVSDLAHRFPSLAPKAICIYNALPLDEIRALGRVDPCGEPWLDHKDVPVFVAVGRLTAQKDFPTLLRALAILDPEPPCKLLVLGDGEDRGRLLDLARQLGLERHVKFAGHRENPFTFMARADALIVSSRWEGFCLVILEALSLGLPVISTDCRSGPAEILDQGRFGRLVPVGDPQALAAAMSDHLRSGFGLEPSELRGRADEFSLERYVNAYLTALRLSDG